MDNSNRKAVNIYTDKWQDWHIVSIEGAFVLTRLDNVRPVFETLGKSPTPQIALDFSRLFIFDSSAITVLVNLYKRLKEVQGKLVIFAPNDDIQNILSIAGLDKVIPVFLTRADFEESYS